MLKIYNLYHKIEEGTLSMKALKAFLLSSCLLAVSSSATAIDFDFSGTFANDNDVALFDFTVGAGGSTVTVFSSSWLAGDNGMGFDPILGIWDNAGNLITQQDDGHNTGSTLSNGVLYSHGTWDSYYDVFLAAGDYTASITQYSNFAAGTTLAEGFTQDGNPNFTFDLGYGSQPMFNGVWSSTDARTGDWEFHILNVAAAEERELPAPATLALMGLGLAGIGFARKKKQA
ncbi:MAG: DVUA0089 family protein [Sedimenticola sp.]